MAIGLGSLMDSAAAANSGVDDYALLTRLSDRSRIPLILFHRVFAD
jgi:hypothetical protein